MYIHVVEWLNVSEIVAHKYVDMPDFITVITFLSETTVGVRRAEAEICACARQVPAYARFGPY